MVTSAHNTLKEFPSLNTTLAPHLSYLVPSLDSFLPPPILVPPAAGFSPAAQGLGVTWASNCNAS